MAGKDAFGTQFQVESVTPGSYTTVAHVTNITPPAIERETLDVTSHGSTEGWQEFIGGLKNGGELSIELNYDPTVHDALVEHMDDADPKNYKIVWPGTLGDWTFTAVMTGFAPEAPHDGKLTAEASFQVSGKPTLTPGA
ncbi:phage tail tube protein [Streptomyces ovatisporus]|uniref:Phage tail tube protein n=1 Tax=Streptomyces ovatisporus TaxID=1128682 RepID=A0ABV9A926_9ACTN